MYEWNPNCITRLLGSRDTLKGGEQVEVMIHQDGSVFHVKEYGNFISHLQTNMNDQLPLRNFTCDTVPFVVHTNTEGRSD